MCTPHRFPLSAALLDRRRKTAARQCKVPAAYFDELVEYLQHCPHRLAQSSAAKQELLYLFALHHRQLPSAELTDPGPLVRSFCRAVLQQYDVFDGVHPGEGDLNPADPNPTPRRRSRSSRGAAGGAQQ